MICDQSFLIQLVTTHPHFCPILPFQAILLPLSHHFVRSVITLDQDTADPHHHCWIHFTVAKVSSFFHQSVHIVPTYRWPMVLPHCHHSSDPSFRCWQDVVVHIIISTINHSSLFFHPSAFIPASYSWCIALPFGHHFLWSAISPHVGDPHL